VWAETQLVEAGGLVLASQTFGPWYWFHIAYAYTLIAVGSLLLIRLVFVSDYLYLDQSVLLLVGVVIPVVSNAASVVAATPLPGIDLTPYALTITGVTFGYALFRSRLFDLVPATRHIGRNVAIRDLEDGVVIVDDERQVVYCNEAAADLFDVEQSAMLGQKLSQFVDDVIDFDTEDALGELSLDDRTYELRSSTITDHADSRIGYTLVVTDITGRKRREEMLRRQRDQLQTLDAINHVIRSVNQALVGASTRDEVERAVVDRLVDSEFYDAVCIGAANRPASEFTCRTNPDGTVASATDGGEHAIISAMRDAEGVTDPDQGPRTLTPDTLAADDTAGRWTTVPLVYERTVYGVLVVFSTRPDAFGERELDVLDELGETIGHAINAIENRHLLLSDAVVEMELACTDDASALVTASDALGCTLELEGLVPIADHRLLVYLHVSGADPATACAELTAAGVEDARPVDDSDTIECTLESGSVFVPLAEYGTNVREATVDSGRTELLVELAPDADARTVVERIQTEYPDTTMLAKREHRPTDAGKELSESALADLTDRQQEVLEAAYLGGYFNWPRDSTAEEVADSLDIASATLHDHLRKAQRKVLDEILADTTDRSRTSDE
jgi:predicted DNA binding protein/PAS domain-containing protein